MAKFLIHANYTTKGAHGLLQEGGSKRREALTQTVEGLGGTLECLYYAFGSVDLILIADFPDEATALAFSMRINAVAALDLTMTKLVTVDTVDSAIAKDVSYRAPGE